LLSFSAFISLSLISGLASGDIIEVGEPPPWAWLNILLKVSRPSRRGE